MKKIPVVALALVCLLPSLAVAMDIDGKWGLSAPLLNSVPGEYSLIRGHERGAWVLDAIVSVFKSSDEEQEPSINPDVQTNFDLTFWEVGPRMRRYGMPDASFSPYYDLFIHGSYSRQGGGQVVNSGPNYSNSSTSRAYGVILGGGLGVELFTKWGLSAALSSRVVALSWFSRRSTAHSDAPGTSDADLEGSLLSLNLEFQPRIYIRGYW